MGIPTTIEFVIWDESTILNMFVSVYDGRSYHSYACPGPLSYTMSEIIVVFF